ncbi:MAG: prenyltransferase [Thermoplasmata archaeon]
MGTDLGVMERFRRIVDISSRGGKVPPIYLYIVFVLPGIVYSISKTGIFNYIPLISVAVIITPLIAATNLFDDYFDYRRGIDKIDSPNTTYRHHPIFYYGVSTGYLLRWASILSAIYVGLSLIISIRYGWTLIFVALTGMLLGYGYTGWPIGYKYRGLGELGVLISTIAASEFISLAAIGHFYVSSILYFVPFSIIIALLLFIGNYRDLESDRKSGLITLAVRLGKRNSEIFSVVLFTVFYASVIILFLFGIYGQYSLVNLLTAPLAFFLSIRLFTKESSKLERYAGPYLFGILLLLLLLIAL